MLDAKRLREQATSAASVAALWRKAVESARDAELSGLSIDGSLRAAYDAGHLAALALLGVHGLRPTSGQGHHEVAFAAATVLGGASLSELLADSEEIRSLRRGSMYDPTIAGPADRKLALEWMRRTLPAVRAALVVTERSLGKILEPYP